MRFLIAIALFAGLALLADQLVEAQVEQRAANVAGEVLAAQVAIDLQGTPFLYHALSGRLPGAVLRAEQVPVPGRDATLPLLEISLRGVEVSFAALSSSTLPSAESGTFMARLDANSLGALAQIPLTAGQVEIAPGEVRFHGDGVETALLVSAEAGKLVLRLADAPDAEPVYRADLSALPGAPRVLRAAAFSGVLELYGELDAP